MTLEKTNKFTVDSSFSYVGNDKEFEDDEFISEIGDVKTDGQFLPQLKIKRWDNDANFSARIKNASHVEPTITDDKIVYTTKEYTARFYYLQEGFEFDITQHVKPPTPIIEFSLRHKNLSFYYQPALTQDQIDDGYERPEDVVGSYAVYHNAKRNHIQGKTNYKAGKAFHIKRPWAEDAKGTRVWCELYIDPDNNLMTITLPASFYASATWPVLIDPTFGYEVIGASNTNSLNRGFGHGNSGQQYTASSGDVVTTFHLYTRNINDTANCGIYDKSGGGNGGATLLAGDVTLTSTSGTAAFMTQSANIALTAGNTHFPAYWSANGIRRYFDTGVAGDSTEDQTGASVLQSTWTQNTTDDELVTFFVTFTESGGDTLVADSGTYTYAGTDAGLLKGSVLAADSGTYAYTGTDVNLIAGALLSADAGVYTYTGTAADLLKGSVVDANSGTYTYTGTDAALIFASAGDFTLVADSGAYAYIGTNTDLLQSKILTADTGAYVYTGTDADLMSGFIIQVDSGSYDYAGTDVDFVQQRVLDALTGAYVYNGTNANIFFTPVAPDVPAAKGINSSGAFGGGISVSATFGSGIGSKGSL